MKKRTFFIFTLTCNIVIHLNLIGFSKSKKEIAKQYYQQGLQFYKQSKTDSAIAKFRKALKYNRKLADAHNQLALIYMDQGTVYSRFLATLEMEKALRLDWKNPEYRFNNALLYLKKDLTASAEREFKKVAKLDPQNYLAYYHLGLIKEKDVMRYRDMIDPELGGIIYFREFAEKDKQKVIYYWNKTIALNPHFTEIYYRLGLLYYEFDDLDEMIQLLQKAVKINPADKNCHLFLGFAYHQAEKYQLADQQYESAIELMERDERKIFESIDIIMSNEEKTFFDSSSFDEQQQIKHVFWKNKDPLFLTEQNERKLEHYSRIAYANLRYSIPEKNIEGWQTDQGKVLIRYGKPKIFYRTRPEFGGAANADYFESLNTSKEVWTYDDFNFVFDDRFLQSRYEFAWGDRPDNDYRTVYEQLIKETPEIYELVPQRQRLEIAADLTEFKGDAENTKLELSYALPADSIYLVLRNDNWQTRMEQGIFVFDKEWNEVCKSTTEVNIPEGQIRKIGNDKYFIDQSQLNVLSGSYNIALEVHDLESNRWASLRKEIEIRSFQTNKLQTSDVLLAYHIVPDSTSTTFKRNDLGIVPNPLKKFPLNFPIYIYYEIYNLSRDEDGRTSFKIEYTISDNKQKASVLKKVLEKLKLVKYSGDVTTSYQYLGNSSTEYQYQKIDLNQSRRGNLNLFVTVTDLNNHQTVTQKVEFRVEPEQ